MLNIFSTAFNLVTLLLDQSLCKKLKTFVIGYDFKNSFNKVFKNFINFL